MKTPIHAYGKYYFKTPSCPIAVQIISSDRADQHEYDLTSTEHFHDFSEIVLILFGSGIQNINGREYPVNSGDIFLLNGYTKHYFSKRENLVLYNLQFSAKDLPLPECYLRKLPGYNMFFLQEPNLRNQFRKMVHTSEEEKEFLAGKIWELREILTNRKPGFEAAAFASLLGILIRLSGFLPETGAERNSPFQRIGNVISFMESHYTESWTLQELSHKACMSVNNFLRIFRSATGYSPQTYLQMLRLNRGAELLIKSSLSVGMIAEQCGFYDSNYFCKLFRRRYNTSPKEFRLNNLLPYK